MKRATLEMDALVPGVLHIGKDPWKRSSSLAL